MSTELAIRDATPWDMNTAAGVLASAALVSPIGRWLESNAVCGVLLFERFRTVVADGVRHGVVRVVEVSGGTVAVAVWLPCSQQSVFFAEPTWPGPDASGFARRLFKLDRALVERHPVAAHEHLAYLGTLPAHQQRGIGTRLITEPRRFITGSGPRYVTVPGELARRSFQRHGYEADEEPIVIADYPIELWPLWRREVVVPEPQSPVNQAGHRFSAAAGRLIDVGRHLRGKQ
ncbi:GNAT family N-acetyltransferase [Actinoplanes flavus]|uniref:GNAT family N-acetyltransferase n=1 Tax=Actinoplanes flavus TaxID=2820290 RepID=A0ABS3UD42_9ACTN|nr:GNAT family N-acetyltransferase [Actinoplanes flavus]MBO3736699.1 GNAT family N-acetyltransferase [Actinoplanes flavus]